MAPATYSLKPSEFLPNQGDFYVRVVHPMIFNGFNWERPQVNRLPSGTFIGPNMVFPYEEGDFLLLKHTTELMIKGARITQLQKFYICHQGKVYRPTKTAKERLKEFLKQQGLPPTSLQGRGELLGALRLIHAATLGFNLEGTKNVM